MSFKMRIYCIPFCLSLLIALASSSLIVGLFDLQYGPFKVAYSG